MQRGKAKWAGTQDFGLIVKPRGLHLCLLHLVEFYMTLLLLNVTSPLLNFLFTSLVDGM